MGLRQELDVKGLIAFTKDFLRRMLKEQILSLLFLMGWGLLLAPLGYLACCVGIVVVAAFLSLAQHHLKYQMYELYLSRGGQPIPEKQPSEPPRQEPPPGELPS